MFKTIILMTLIILSNLSFGEDREYLISSSIDYAVKGDYVQNSVGVCAGFVEGDIFAGLFFDASSNLAAKDGTKANNKSEYGLMGQKNGKDLNTRLTAMKKTYINGSIIESKVTFIPEVSKTFSIGRRMSLRPSAHVITGERFGGGAALGIGYAVTPNGSLSVQIKEEVFGGMKSSLISVGIGFGF